MLKVVFLFALTDVVPGLEMQNTFYLENIFYLDVSWTGQWFIVGSRIDVSDDDEDDKQ